MEGFNGIEDKVTEVTKGEYDFKLLVTMEEGDTDAFNEELQRFIHVVGEWDGNFEVLGNRRKVGDAVEVFWAIKTRMQDSLDEFQLAADGTDDEWRVSVRVRQT